MKVNLKNSKIQKGSLEITLTDQDIYNLLEEKGVFLDLEESVLESSEFDVQFLGQTFRHDDYVDSDSPIFCKLSWEFEE
jgi:hypothetical protein